MRPGLLLLVGATVLTVGTTPCIGEDADGDGVPSHIDCNDQDASIFPGAPESCNGQDDNCDGQADEGLGTWWYLDADGDGSGDAEAGVLDCDYPGSPYVANGSDCDDSDPGVHPGVTDTCNGVDSNCNGVVDDDPPTLCPDQDGDLHGDTNSSYTGCNAPPGYVACSMYFQYDCNDADPGIYFGAYEACDGIDNDCDQSVDEACDQDQDQDGMTGDEGDCNDLDPYIGPHMQELCGDWLDNDCDGKIDDEADCVADPLPIRLYSGYYHTIVHDMYCAVTFASGDLEVEAKISELGPDPEVWVEITWTDWQDAQAMPLEPRYDLDPPYAIWGGSLTWGCAGGSCGNSYDHCFTTYMRLAYRVNGEVWYDDFHGEGFLLGDYP